MQHPDDTESLGATSGDEADQEDGVDAHVAGTDGNKAKHEEAVSDADEADQEESGSDANEARQKESGSDADEAKEEESGSDADEAKEEESDSDADDDIQAGSDADDDDDDDDVQADAPAAGPEADGDLDLVVRAAGLESDSDDDEAAGADEEIEANPAGNRRANFLVAASLLLAAIVTVTATLYALPPPDVTHSAHQRGLAPTFPTGDVAFSTIHNFPRGGTAIANDDNKKLNYYNLISDTVQVGVGSGDDSRYPSVLLRRSLSVVFTSFLHMFYFWHLFGVLDLVLLSVLWVLMGIILYHG